MDMMLNSLPTRTWNRLGMNESFVTIKETTTNHILEAAGPVSFWTPKADPSCWSGLKSGMGQDMSALTGPASIGLVQAAPGEAMEAPLLLTYDYAEEERSISRLKLHAAKDSKLSVILLLRSSRPDAGGLSAIQTEIYAEQGSCIQLYVAQLLGSGFTCLNDIGAFCEDNASIEVTKLELGAGTLYAGAEVDLSGKESHFTTNMGYYVRQGQRIDMNYVALHHGEKSESFMDVSGTLEEGSRKLFRGTIDFQKGCAGAKGTETENVLLMGEDMINQTIPLILCKEEDVEGNHGATIGQLDEKVLFYLGSRGISEKTAQQIIAQSRIDAICDKIPDETVRAAVHEFQL